MSLNLKWLPRINYAVYNVFQDSMYSTVFTMLYFVKSIITHFNKHSRGRYAIPLFGEYMMSILPAQASAEPWQNLKLAFRLFRQPCTPMEADKATLEQEIMYIFSILLRLVHSSGSNSDHHQ